MLTSTSILLTHFNALCMLLLAVLVVKGCEPNKEKDTHQRSATVKQSDTATAADTQFTYTSATNRYWHPYAVNDLPDLEFRIRPNEFTAWKCDIASLRQDLKNGEEPIMFPTGSGMAAFKIEPSGTMSPELSSRFPELGSYKGHEVNGTTTLRLDINEQGVFAEFKNNENIYLLAPLLKGSDVYYALYLKSEQAPTPRDSSYR
ncbi:MAG: hypothetical protein Kow0075_13860 [Salibacteraceae bacterium]